MSDASSRRALSLAPGPDTPVPQRSLVDITAAMLPSIQATREYPAVSVIVAAEGPTFGAADRARGEELVAEVARRLAYEFALGTVANIVDPLRRALAEMVGARVEGGVALLCATGELHAFRLSITPTERVVVDPTFATRDLVRSLAESEPYGIVVLAKDRARFMVVTPVGARLVAEIDERASLGRSADRRGHQHRSERAGRDRRQVEAFLARVSHRVNAEPALRSLDLVTVAPDHLSARFQRLHRPSHGARVVGRIPGNRLDASPKSVACVARTVIGSHRRTLEHEVLEQLARADREGRADRGVEAAWHALHHASVVQLVVEHDFAFAAYLAPEGTELLPAAVRETPAATDDLVDEMIELTMSKLGTVSFVEPGSLGGDGVVVIRRH
jgi:hypothetical protein